MWAARILLVGILAIAAISIIGTAIAMAAPYLAALIVICGGGWILNHTVLKDPPPPPP